MFLIRALLPMIYCLFVGTAYGMLSKKKFIDSLAPSFFLQIVFMLLAGITIKRLSVGVAVYVGISLIVIIWTTLRTKKYKTILNVFTDDGHVDLGIYLFVFVYIFIFISNVSKHYYMWDEFSHWGWFVRESFYKDALYCSSSEAFMHKEYVPGVALFETLWCKLSLRYSEPDAYRGIQMLQASMMMPVATRISKGFSNTHGNRSERVLFMIFNTIIIFSIPLFSKLPFYHTLYQDLILGVFVFYCIWITICENFGLYSLFMMGLSLCMLALCKMTALAFVPILFLFYVIYHQYFANKELSRIKIWMYSLVTVVISVIPWWLYNSFAGEYIKSNNDQNYNSIKLSSIVDVITHNGNIRYQDDVESAYINAIRNKGIIGGLSYVWVIIGIVVLLLLLMLVVKDSISKRKIGLIGLWIFLAGIYYSFFMYVMYMLMFSEYEARGLASFDRYMSTFVLVALLMTAMTYIVFASESYRYVSYFVIILLVENIIVFFGAEQLLPGVITHEQIQYEGHAEFLSNSLPHGASLLFVSSAADIDAVVKVHFYCEGTYFASGVYGEPVNDADIYSKELSIPEFVDECTQYDYIYFFSYGDDFIELYQDAFEEQDVIAPGKLYKIEKVDGKIRTQGVG